MTNREGNLEAPTRHPVAWKTAEFYEQAACEKEMERVFDICHGCRRCVNLCTAFPTLFDLVDSSPTLEIDGVAPQERAQPRDPGVRLQLVDEVRPARGAGRGPMDEDHRHVAPPVR